MKGLLLLERLGPGLRLTVALFLALALLISLAAAPVAAAEKPSDHQYEPRNNDNDNNNNRNNNNNNNRNNKNNGGGGGGGGAFEIAQHFEQETESGDVEQSLNVSNTGDNSNQCANVNGTTNTGNLETQSGSIQFASDIDEFEQEDIGSELSVSGDSTVTCDQQVNQAAAAG